MRVRKFWFHALVAAAAVAALAPAASAAPTAEALREAHQASMSCAEAKSAGDERRFADYRAAKERAIKADSSVVRELYAAGTTYGDLFSSCDREIPIAIKVRKELKGDRSAVFEREGAPDRFAGESLQAAAIWEYRRTPSGTSFVCTIKYSFRGNKISKKSKSGVGCVLVD